MENAVRRIQAVQHAFAPENTSDTWKRVLVLPDDTKVDVLTPSSPDAAIPSSNEHKADLPSSPLIKIALNGIVVCQYRILPRSLALVVSAIGTPYENKAEHVPKFPLLELLPSDSGTNEISIPDLWAIVYTLHTLYHIQETIPIVLSPAILNIVLCNTYLLHSGLARKRHSLSISTVASEPELFLLRATFWQGAGILGYHGRGWLRGESATHGHFPYVQSFTRSSLVITSHPHRPPKPHQGECVYKKYWPSMGKSLEFTYFDLEEGGDNGKVGRHLEAFHRWQNDPRVHKGWGEQGTIEYHREYVKRAMDDPSILPLIMSWDGDLMGYCEIVWLKVSSSHSGYDPTTNCENNDSMQNINK